MSCGRQNLQFRCCFTVPGFIVKSKQRRRLPNKSVTGKEQGRAAQTDPNSFEAQSKNHYLGCYKGTCLVAFYNCHFPDNTEDSLSLSLNIKMGKKPVKYSVVDAFTDSAFKGSPAAVCLLEEERDDEWLQSVAAEFNLAATCYLTRIAEPEPEVRDSVPNPRFRLRWFNPLAEVKLCGHGSLAASHFLFNSGLFQSNNIEFLTLSGVLTAKRVPETEQADFLNSENGEAQCYFSIELDFPATPLTEFDSAEIPWISKALNGASMIDMKKTTTYCDLLVVLPSGKTVADLQPQFDEILRWPGRGVIVTGIAPPGSGFDFFSRFFCPKSGINEDPACGTAHCALANYWSKKLGKCDLVAYQASPRGAIFNLHLDEKSQRVLLRGKAISITEGYLLV